MDFCFVGVPRLVKEATNSPVLHNAYHDSLHYSSLLETRQEMTVTVTNTSEASFSVFFLCLSLALSSCVVVCFVVVVVVVSCCGVCAVCVCCETLEEPPCVRSKRPRVYRLHAHMLKHMCAWCRQTRRRFESTHGSVFSGQGEVIESSADQEKPT